MLIIENLDYYALFLRKGWNNFNLLIVYNHELLYLPE